MDRKQFDSLSIDKQIEYINEELKNSSSLTKICTEIGIDRSTIRKRAKKVGQEYDGCTNQYISDNSKTSVTYDESKANTINDICQTIVPKDIIKEETLVTNKEVLKNLLNLSDKYDKIMEVVSWFESDVNKTNVIEVREGIKIDLPEEIDLGFRKTIRR